MLTFNRKCHGLICENGEIIVGLIIKKINTFLHEEVKTWERFP